MRTDSHFLILTNFKYNRQDIVDIEHTESVTANDIRGTGNNTNIALYIIWFGEAFNLCVLSAQTTITLYSGITYFENAKEL